MPYLIKPLVEQKFPFAAVFPEKQKLVAESAKMNFSLPQIVDYLRMQTNNFTVDNPVALDLDKAIYKLVEEYQKKQGAPPQSAPVPAPAEEPTSAQDAAGEEDAVPEATPMPAPAAKPAVTKESLEKKLRTYKMMSKDAPDDKKLKNKVKTYQMMIDDFQEMEMGGKIENGIRPFANIDYDRLIDSGVFYATKDSNEWKIFSEKTQKPVGVWFENEKELLVYVRSKELWDWLKKNSYLSSYEIEVLAKGGTTTVTEYYNSHGYKMPWSEVMEIEVEERGNYKQKQVDEWKKKYGISDTDKTIWVTPDIYAALSYTEVEGKDSDKLRSSSTSQKVKDGIVKKLGLGKDDLAVFTTEGGFIIPESDDGDNGYLFIVRQPQMANGGGIGDAMPSIHEVESNGEELESYPVDESQTASNAGTAVEYLFNDKKYVITTWDEEAAEHEPGSKEIALIEGEEFAKGGRPGKKSVQALCDELWAMREKYENELSSNSIQWIDDDLDRINVDYFQKIPDSSEAERIKEENNPPMTEQEAIELLQVRIGNTKSALGIYAEGGELAWYSPGGRGGVGIHEVLDSEEAAQTRKVELEKEGFAVKIFQWNKNREEYSLTANKKYEKGGELTAAKSRAILHDGKIRGKKLTPKQIKFFGAIASGQKPYKFGVGGKIGGSGWGKLKKRKQVKKFSELKDGMILLEENKQFKAKNVIKITNANVRPEYGELAYAHFVNPENTNEKRTDSDQEFSIRDNEIEKSIWGNKYYLVKGQKLSRQKETGQRLSKSKQGRKAQRGTPEMQEKYCKGGEEFVTIVYDANKFTLTQAKEWAVKHGFVMKSEGGKKRIRTRVQEPRLFNKSSLKTISIEDGIHAIVGAKK